VSISSDGRADGSPWPPGRPRVLVADAWLANAGDGAITLVTERRIRQVAPDAAILHGAYQGDLLAGAYPQLEFAPPLAGLLGVVPAIPELAGWDAERASRLLAETDAVLSQGGGFAIEYYGSWERLRSWEMLAEQGKPLAFGAQTVGPFRRARNRAALRRAYRGARGIAVRDPDSAVNVIEVSGAADRVMVAADEAFALFPAPPAEAPAPHGVAVTLSAHPTIALDGSAADRRCLLPELAATITGLVEALRPEPVTLMSTQQGLGGADRGLEDDSDFAAEVVAAMPAHAASAVERTTEYLPPLRFAERLATHRAVLTMRMHPAILALSRGVPAVLMNTGFKVQGMASALRLEDLLARGHEPQSLVSQVLAACDGGPRGEELWRRLEEARRRADRNQLVVEALLAS
jgi:polysaccharide pyruvyl transferase WcaK-like protein